MGAGNGLSSFKLSASGNDPKKVFPCFSESRRKQRGKLFAAAQRPRGAGAAWRASHAGAASRPGGWAPSWTLGKGVADIDRRHALCRALLIHRLVLSAGSREVGRIHPQRKQKPRGVKDTEPVRGDARVLSHEGPSRARCLKGSAESSRRDCPRPTNKDTEASRGLPKAACLQSAAQTLIPPFTPEISPRTLGTDLIQLRSW